MARSIDQIISELNSVYQPQIENINAQIAALPAQYQAQKDALNVAKENAFRDITGAASAKGMVYSGMPIQEQTRYTGTKYLPALAQLEAQQNQQRFNFQTMLADLYNKRMSQAQAIRQQELDREQREQLERERIAAAERAARARAASSVRYYGGGGGRASGGGGGITNREAYNQRLRELEGLLARRQAPHYEDAVRQLVRDFSGRGISPQEIGEYLYQLYGRYFNVSNTKKFYG
jgi:hypothetical protein